MDKKKCNKCGKMREDVALLINPYVKELYNREEYENLCQDCYHDLVHSI